MKLRTRRLGAVAVVLIGVVVWVFVNPKSYETSFIQTSEPEAVEVTENTGTGTLAVEVLELLEVKGRAPKTGYSREEFYSSWPIIDGCSLRQRIIKRDFGETAVLDGCNVVAGEYDEPYTGEHLVLTKKEEISDLQIDHIVALSDAWQKGAQYMSEETRHEIATDPLNLG